MRGGCGSRVTKAVGSSQGFGKDCRRGWGCLRQSRLRAAARPQIPPKHHLLVLLQAISICRPKLVKLATADSANDDTNSLWKVDFAKSIKPFRFSYGKQKQTSRQTFRYEVFATVGVGFYF